MSDDLDDYERCYRESLQIMRQQNPRVGPSESRPMTSEMIERIATEHRKSQELPKVYTKEDLANIDQGIASDISEVASILTAAGYAIVPVEATREMLNAAIDVDSFKLGDIGPLGFRISPQQLFAKCYRAMLSAFAQEK